jgi:hypothetical protein
MTHPTEPWFTSLVSLEILFQLPFFLYAVNCLLQNRFGPFFRPLCIVYGSSTATTLIPILANIASNVDTTTSEKGILFGFYLPYLIFPLWLTIVCVFDEAAAVAKKKKQ